MPDEIAGASAAAMRAAEEDAQAGIDASPRTVAAHNIQIDRTLTQLQRDTDALTLAARSRAALMQPLLSELDAGQTKLGKALVAMQAAVNDTVVLLNKVNLEVDAAEEADLRHEMLLRTLETFKHHQRHVTERTFVDQL